MNASKQATSVHPAMPVNAIASPRRFARTAALLAAGAAALSLGGCYVVPVQPDGRPYPVPGVTAPAPTTSGQALPVPPSPTVIPVRMYPTNDAAAPSGAVAGAVTSHYNGRAEFHFIRAGENYVGEATRFGGQKNGVANAAGSKGGYANCQYAMSNPSLGTGSCKFSDGAVYTLHVGQ
jgi:hypothetical protein